MDESLEEPLTGGGGTSGLEAVGFLGHRALSGGATSGVR